MFTKYLIFLIHIFPPLCLFAPKRAMAIFVVFRSHTTTHHSRQGSSGQVISSSQRYLTHNSHNRQISMPHGRIRNRNTSKRAAEGPQLRPRGHRYRLLVPYYHNITYFFKYFHATPKYNTIISARRPEHPPPHPAKIRINAYLLRIYTFFSL